MPCTTGAGLLLWLAYVAKLESSREKRGSRDAVRLGEQARMIAAVAGLVSIGGRGTRVCDLRGEVR